MAKGIEMKGVILRVKAGACEKCGERFYTKEVPQKDRRN